MKYVHTPFELPYFSLKIRLLFRFFSNTVTFLDSDPDPKHLFNIRIRPKFSDQDRSRNRNTGHKHQSAAQDPDPPQNVMDPEQCPEL